MRPDLHGSQMHWPVAMHLLIALQRMPSRPCTLHIHSEVTLQSGTATCHVKKPKCRLSQALNTGKAGFSMNSRL
jgi:hypothetical protein